MKYAHFRVFGTKNLLVHHISYNGLYGFDAWVEDAEKLKGKKPLAVMVAPFNIRVVCKYAGNLLKPGVKKQW